MPIKPSSNNKFQNSLNTLNQFKQPKTLTQKNLLNGHSFNGIGKAALAGAGIMLLESMALSYIENTASVAIGGPLICGSLLGISGCLIHKAKKQPLFSTSWQDKKRLIKSGCASSAIAIASIISISILNPSKAQMPPFALIDFTLAMAVGIAVITPAAAAGAWTSINK